MLLNVKKIFININILYGDGYMIVTINKIIAGGCVVYLWLIACDIAGNRDGVDGQGIKALLISTFVPVYS